jgi:hypothetical protein
MTRAGRNEGGGAGCGRRRSSDQCAGGIEAIVISQVTTSSMSPIVLLAVVSVELTMGAAVATDVAAVAVSAVVAAIVAVSVAVVTVDVDAVTAGIEGAVACGGDIFAAVVVVEVLVGAGWCVTQDCACSDE